jgi:hypothetical protein
MVGIFMSMRIWKGDEIVRMGGPATGCRGGLCKGKGHISHYSHHNGSITSRKVYCPFDGNPNTAALLDGLRTCFICSADLRYAERYKLLGPKKEWGGYMKCCVHHLRDYPKDCRSENEG